MQDYDIEVLTGNESEVIEMVNEYIVAVFSSLLTADCVSC